ncbi:MAG: InlB B-repeat-containing protein [Clostridia bacterium]|nr:InlB B-repeat-containing protein [Clostridia bacterium]
MKCSSGGGYSRKPLKIAASIALSLMLGGIACISGGFATSVKTVNVGELWDSASNEFNYTNFRDLIGNFGSTIQDMSNINSYASQRYTAEKIRNAVGYDLIVELGGLTWTPTYLSCDDEGNTILTLYMSSGYQEAFVGKSSSAGNYYGFKDGILYSGFSAGYTNSSYTVVYPSSMYGTSYIRAVTLNNGGVYGRSTTDYAVWSQTSSSVFAPFTMTTDGNDLADYIVAPANMPMHRGQNSIDNNVNASNTYPNESTTAVSGASWSSSAPMVTNPDYYNWQHDKLWIPSLSETGYSDTYNGIWKLSESQREHGNGTGGSASTGGSVGSLAMTCYTTVSWVRSNRPSNSETNWGLYASGTNYTYLNVKHALVVRPALHLNLTAAAYSLTYKNYDELWDDENKKFDSANLDCLLREEFGSSLTDITNLDSGAEETWNAEDFCHDEYNPTVTLGGLDWYMTYLSKDEDGNVILTLWLTGEKQSAFEGRGYAEGDYYGFINGRLYSDWSANFATSYFTTTYPGSMYGTSYVRSVTLNNGGEYKSQNAIERVDTFSQSASSVFAPFTMGSENEMNIADYIVSPSKVSWQAGQNLVDHSGYSPIYTLPNESTTEVANPSWYTHSTYGSASAMTTNKYYYSWAEDKLWLPSVSEIGYKSSDAGIWGCNVSQKATGTGKIGYETTSGGGAGGLNTDNPNLMTWLRSGSANSAYGPCSIAVNGLECFMESISTSKSAVVRPALHLNLTEAIKSTETRDFKVTYAGANAEYSDYLEVYLEDGSMYVGDCGGSIAVSSTETYTTDYSTKPINFTIYSTASETLNDIFLRVGSAPTLTEYDGKSSFVYTWVPTESVVLDVYIGQRFTVTYDKNGGSGTLARTTGYMMFGTSFLVDQENTLSIGESFGANGWNTKADGSGTAYAYLDSYYDNADVTLYAQWKPWFSTVTIEIMTFSQTEGGFVNSTIGGTLVFDYFSGEKMTELFYAAELNDASVTRTDFLLKKAITFNALPSDGYVFAGVSAKGECPYDARVNVFTPTLPSKTGTTYTVQAYFVQISGNRLKYDATEKYFYFEDGEYPQTYVGNSLNATLASKFSLATSVAEYHLTYFNGSKDVKVPVYLYNGEKYAMLTAEKTTTLTLNGTSVSVTEGNRYFFKVEPIRWRVSDYGVAADEYPSDWATYGTYKENFTVVSDKILTASAVTNQKAQEGWSWLYSQMYENNIVDSLNMNFSYKGSGEATIDKFAPAGTQNLVSSIETISSGVKTVYVSEMAGLSDLSAKATDFAAFLLGADGGDKVEYWTRSLGWDLLQGKTITVSGSTSSNWLETMLGVRFSCILSEGAMLFE